MFYIGTHALKTLLMNASSILADGNVGRLSRKIFLFSWALNKNLIADTGIFFVNHPFLIQFKHVRINHSMP